MEEVRTPKSSSRRLRTPKSTPRSAQGPPPRSGRALKPEDVDRMFDAVDSNEDGVIDFAEFQKAYDMGEVVPPPSGPVATPQSGRPDLNRQRPGSSRGASPRGGHRRGASPRGGRRPSPRDGGQHTPGRQQASSRDWGGGELAARAGVQNASAALVNEEQVRAMARAVMELADDVVVDNRIEVVEARRFLRGTPYESFVRWLTDDKLSEFQRHDADHSGTLELPELEAAVQSYLQGAPDPMRVGTPGDRVKSAMSDQMRAASVDDAVRQYRASQGVGELAGPPDAMVSQAVDEYTRGGAEEPASSAQNVAPKPQARGNREEEAFAPLVVMMERGHFVEDLRRLFGYYCSVQERSPVTELSSAKFAKFCGDAGLLEGQLQAGVINIVFLQAIRSGEQRRSRMSWAQFLLGVAMVAARKFPLYPTSEALQIVLDNHVLPLATRLVPPPEWPEQQDAEVARLFASARGPLQALFKLTCRMAGVGADQHRLQANRLGGMDVRFVVVQEQYFTWWNVRQLSQREMKNFRIGLAHSCATRVHDKIE